MQWFKKTLLPRITALPSAARFGVAIVIGALLLFSLFRTTSGDQKADYLPVYSDLSLEDAGLVTERLKTLEIPYRRGDTGSSVMVPAGRVVEARIALAQDGLPRSSRSGLKLLENGSMGDTREVISAKLLRAREQELESTLIRFIEVKDARVHLALAPQVLFEADRVPSTAGVMLTLLPGVHLAAERVEAVQTIVAASISGLSPEEVNVTDSMGNLLAKAGSNNDLGVLSDRRLKLQQMVENHLQSKVENLLGGVLGSRRSAVAINVQLDFDAIEEEHTTYDPDKAAVRSEERHEGTSGPNSGSTETSTTNYELNSSIERVAHAPGSIERLSAAVFVEGEYREGEEGTEYVPQTAEELEHIRTMVASALGFSAERGDVITVSDRRFNRSEEQAYQSSLVAARRNQLLYDLGLRLILLAGVVAAYYPTKRLVRLIPQVESALQTHEPPARQAMTEEETATVTPEEEERRQVHEEVTELAIDSPANVAQLIRTWLAESPQRTGA
jgi:flagellar M-ring protein FliF